MVAMVIMVAMVMVITVIMVVIVIVVKMVVVMNLVVMVGTGQDRTEQDRTKLTFKLDFLGNLCLAAFAILAMFSFGLYTKFQINKFSRLL